MTSAMPLGREGIDPDGPLGAIQSTSAVSAVARRLLTHFTSGAIAPGERLPAERQLAASLGVGRSAVREALAALEILGIVAVRPGSGTYLKGTVSELLPQTLSWGFMLGEPRTRELIEVRYGLEVQAARLAAAAVTDDDVAELDRLVDRMLATQVTFTEFTEADMLFHQALGRIAGNTVLADLLRTIRSLIRVWVERGVDTESETQRTCREHRAIVDALRSRDADAVAAAMGGHMDSARARLLASMARGDATP